MDFLLDALSHSWGKSPEQKKREKEYNAKYYQEHKEEILRNRPRQREKYVTDGGMGVQVRKDKRAYGRANSNVDNFVDQVSSQGANYGTIAATNMLQELQSPEGQNMILEAAKLTAKTSANIAKEVYKEYKNKYQKKVREFLDPVSSWKIGAKELKDTYKIGMDTIKGWFK